MGGGVLLSLIVSAASGGQSILPSFQKHGGLLARVAPERGRATSGWPLPSSALLHAAAPWALWTSAAADDMVGALIGANLSVFMLWRVLAYPRFITDPHMGVGLIGADLWRVKKGVIDIDSF
ncbi:hypothetical protein TRIUR3_01089 [Triticum urartu]|uniref:Uncharacterized protein n=1 Tax=Triticum urartu TaxID=4572 RepID=M7Z0H8_TRIUA|nr:hypothetical protein TRIUR3_01089 [Triticum urartu]